MSRQLSFELLKAKTQGNKSKDESVIVLSVIQ